jgi:hypothetical protein
VAIPTNQRFIDAAAVAFHAVAVIPDDVVVNVNAFHGTTRDTYPLPFLRTMGTSGLFESWRILEAAAATWYDGPGGVTNIGPTGPSARCARKVLRTRTRRWSPTTTASAQSAPPTWRLARCPISSTIIRRVDEWDVVDDDRTIASYGDPEVRISILWEARVRLSDEHIPTR